MIRRDVGEGVPADRADRRTVHAHVQNVIAGVGRDRERPAPAVIHRLRCARRDAPTRPRRRRDYVRVDGKRRRERVIRRDVGEGVPAHHADRRTVHAHVQNVIAGVRRDGERPAPAVIHRLRCARRDAPTRPRRRRDHVRVDGKRRRERVIRRDVGEGVPAHRADRRAVHAHVQNVIAGVGRDGERPAPAVIHRLRRAGRDAPTRPRRRRDHVRADGKRRRERVIRRDVGEGVPADRADRRAVHAHVQNVIAGIRRDAEHLAPAVIHRLRCARRDAPTRPRRRRDHVRVDGKRRRERVIRRDVGEGVPADRADRRAVHAHVQNVIAGVGRDRERPAPAVIHRLRCARRDAPTRPRRRRDHVRADGKRRRERVIRRDVGEGVPAHRADRRAVHTHVQNVIAGVGRDRERPAPAVIHRLRCARRDAPTRPRRRRDHVRVDGKRRRERVIRRDVGEGVPAYRADRRAVHTHVQNVIAGVGRDGERLAPAVIHRLRRAGRDAPTRPRRRRDHVRVDGKRRRERVIRRDVGEGVPADRADRRAVHTHVQNVIAGVGRDGERLAPAIVHRLRRAGRDAPARPRRRRDHVRADGKRRRERVIRRDVGEGVPADRADRRAVHAHVQNVIAGVGRDRERLAPAVIHRLRCARRDAPTRPRRRRDHVRADGKRRRERVIRRDVGEGVPAHRADRRAVHAHVQNVIAGVGRDGERPAPAVIHRLRCARRDAPTRPRRRRDHVRVDGKRRRERVIRRDVGEGVPAHRADRRAVHAHVQNVIAGVGRDGERLAPAVVHRLRCARRDAPTRPRRRRDHVRADGKRRRERVIRRDVGEGVPAHRADRRAVHTHVQNVIAGVGRDGERLAPAVIHRLRRARRDAPTRPRRRRDHVRVDGKRRRERVIRRDVGEGVPADHADRRAVHTHVQNVIAGVGRDGERLAPAIVHRLRRAGRDAPARPRRRRDHVGVQRERRRHHSWRHPSSPRTAPGR